MIAIACNLMYSLLKRRRIFKRITRKQSLLCICCGFTGIWLCNYMFMIAYRYLSVPEATMLHFLHPMLITVFMVVFFRERFTLSKLGAIVLSTVGMVLVTGTIPAGSSVGIIAAILSGVFYAIYIVLMEKSSLVKVESLTIVMYMSITSTISATVISACDHTLMLPVSPTVWLCDSVIAISSVTAYVLTAYAVRANGATSTAFGSMLEPIASCVFAALLISEKMGRGVLIGGILIIVSVVFSSLNTRPKRNNVV